jgi:hypothetical protein
LQLLDSFTVIMDFCVIAAAATFASVVVTVALFLLSSLWSLFLYFCCHPCHFSHSLFTVSKSLRKLEGTTSASTGIR